MIPFGPILMATLAADGEPKALQLCVETAQAWLMALRTGDDRALAASTALPFTHRTNGLKEKCDAVVGNSKSLRRWAQCLRASKELRLTERDDWRTVRIYRGLPPARLTHLKDGIDDEDGYWVQGFVSHAGVSFGMAFLVVDVPRGGPRIRAFVIDAGPL